MEYREILKMLLLSVDVLLRTVMGMSFSWAISSELRRSRLLDRLRLMIYELFSLSPADKPPSSGATFRVLPETKSRDGDDSGTVSTIISPQTALTSNLWVSTIRIPPRRELQLQRANGMEFFHVVQGRGEWDTVGRSDARTTKPLSQGDAFVVEAHRFVRKNGIFYESICYSYLYLVSSQLEMDWQFVVR